jgi:TolB protein
MKAWWRIAGAALAVGLGACEFIVVDGDLGGGGGAGGNTFSRGFAFVRADRNVYVVDDAGDPNSPRRLTVEGGAWFPTVSRDGRVVAFVFRSGGTTELRRVATSGGAASTLLSSADLPGCAGCGNFRYPTFSPDGQTLVFTLDRSGMPSLARVGADGSGFQVIASGGYFYGAASFFPDGQSVLAVGGLQSGWSNHLLRVRVDGSRSDVITSSLGNEALRVVHRAVLSLDGTRVAFDAYVSSGASRIFVAPLGQSLGSVTMVTDHPGQPGVEDVFPSWRGNAELGFLSSAGGLDNIYRINASTLRGTGSLVVPQALEPSYGGTL